MASIYRRGSVWWTGYYINRKQHCKSLKTRSEEEAKLLKAEIELRLFRGEIRPSQSPSVKVVFEQFFDSIRESRAAWTIKSYETKLQTALKAIGVQRITEITAPRIQAYINDRLKKVSSATVMGNIRALSRFLSFARKRGYIDSDPVKQVERPRTISKRLPRFLSKQEIKHLLEAAKGTPLYAPIATALYAGLRRSELLNLQWEDIDFKRALVYIRARDSFHLKNWEERAVPLHSKLCGWLKRIRKEKGPCFLVGRRPMAANFLSREVIRAMKKAGIKNATLHTLRHTFASQAATAGISLLKISKWLGHKTPQITYSVYAHLEPQDGEIERI